MAPKKKKRSRLVEILLREGVITETQIDKAKSGIRTDCEVYSFISMGYLSDLKVLGYVTEIEYIPYIVLPAYKVKPAVLILLPEDYCRMNCVLPLEKIDENLTVAMIDPFDEATIEEMAEMTGLIVKPVLCSARDFIDVTRTIWLETNS